MEFSLEEAQVIENVENDSKQASALELSLLSLAMLGGGMGETAI
jgi:hypothetical protein